MSYVGETFEKVVLCKFCENQIFKGSILNRVNKLSLEYYMFLISYHVNSIRCQRSQEVRPFHLSFCTLEESYDTAPSKSD